MLLLYYFYLAHFITFYVQMMQKTTIFQIIIIFIFSSSCSYYYFFLRCFSCYRPNTTLFWRHFELLLFLSLIMSVVQERRTKIVSQTNAIIIIFA